MRMREIKTVYKLLKPRKEFSTIPSDQTKNKLRKKRKKK